ncbi:MAG: hypothetical protein JF606_11590 [Burkholderiales bacterium]|nr:hypothetical protein [Burkholderiales bacterium]
MTMMPLEDMPSQTLHDPQPRSDIAVLLNSTIAGALAELQREPSASLGGALRWQCLEAVQLLWQRRDALARVLSQPPRRRATSGESSGDIDYWTLIAEQTVELGTAFLTSFEAIEVEWRELQITARQSPAAGDARPPQAPWPPAPNACAAALWWVVGHASHNDDVRLELMRLGTRLLVPRFIELCRQQLSSTQTSPVVRIESMQPGEWFRMYLHDQWAPAHLTWRSDNGRFFMFSSKLAGRSHSLSRPALERFIARGQIERLTHATALMPGHST